MQSLFVPLHFLSLSLSLWLWTHFSILIIRAPPLRRCQCFKLAKNAAVNFHAWAHRSCSMKTTHGLMYNSALKTIGLPRKPFFECVNIKLKGEMPPPKRNCNGRSCSCPLPYAVYDMRVVAHLMGRGRRWRILLTCWIGLIVSIV